jgi:DNA-binding transcriptional LysR family regulator
MDFDLFDIELFVNIAEANSLTGGAVRSHISIPAASTRIKNIEDRLGTKLLCRTRSGVTLLPSGEAFLLRGRLVLQQLQYLLGDLQEHAPGAKGHVRISGATVALTEYLPDCLRTYLAARPEVMIDLRERSAQETLRDVREGSADIGFVCSFGSPIPTEGLEAVPYRRDPLVLVTAANHCLAARETVSFIETLGFDHVSLFPTSTSRATLEGAASAAHKLLKVRLNMSNFETVCRMIESNIGIGIVPESIAIRNAKTMTIRIIPFSDDWPKLRNMQILVRSRQSLPSFVRELIASVIHDSDCDGVQLQIDTKACRPRSKALTPGWPS